MVLGRIGDVQQPPDLLFPHVSPGRACSEGGVGELQVMHRLVVLKGADEVVSVELSRVLAEGAQREAVLGQLRGCDGDLVVPAE